MFGRLPRVRTDERRTLRHLGRALRTGTTQAEEARRLTHAPLRRLLGSGIVHSSVPRCPVGSASRRVTGAAGQPRRCAVVAGRPRRPPRPAAPAGPHPRRRHRQQGRQPRPARPTPSAPTRAPGPRPFPDAVRLGLGRSATPTGCGSSTTTPTPTPALLERCSPPPRTTPTPTSSAPSSASGPRCAGSSSSASPSPPPAAARPVWSAASTTRASTTRSARCWRSTPPACWSAARCSRSSAGSTRSCRSSATTSTSAGAPPRAGHRTVDRPAGRGLPRRGRPTAAIRRTPLTGRHTALPGARGPRCYMLLANAPAAAAVPASSGWSSARFSGCSATCWSARVGQALDELAALVSLYSRPRRISPPPGARAGSAGRGPGRRTAPAGPLVAALPPRPRLRQRPGRRGHQPGRGRRRAATGRGRGAPPHAQPRRPVVRRRGRLGEDTGAVARFVTSPLAMA